MVNRTRHCTTNYKMLKPFLDAANEHEGYLKCKSEGYMDLTIERLYYNDVYGNPVYSITHYGEQNGDLMSDPDMTFSVADGIIIPLSYRNDYVGVYQEVFKEINGKLMYSQSLLKQLDDFLWHWLQNINDQGFTPNVA